MTTYLKRPFQSAKYELNIIYSLIVAGVGFEESAFKVSDSPYKSSFRYVYCPKSKFA
jgi:hypothetical protein